jgi:hypothetical protein
MENMLSEVLIELVHLEGVPIAVIAKYLEFWVDLEYQFLVPRKVSLMTTPLGKTSLVEKSSVAFGN